MGVLSEKKRQKQKLKLNKKTGQNGLKWLL